MTSNLNDEAVVVVTITEDDDDEWTGQVCQILFQPLSLVHMSRERNGPSKIQEPPNHP